MPALVVHCQEKESETRARTLRPVSQATGISTRTHLFGRVWDVSNDASILRFHGMYDGERLRVARIETASVAEQRCVSEIANRSEGYRLLLG